MTQGRRSVRRRGGRTGTLVLAAAAAALAGAGPAVAAKEARPRSVIETLLAAQNPCAGFQTEIAGQRVGLDELDDVEVRSADAGLVGDKVSLSLEGRLSCRTPDASMFQGDAASDVAARAELTLADCSVGTVSVTLSDFGGSLAGLLEALKPVLEAQLAEAARPMLVDACRGVGGDGAGGLAH